MIEIIDFEKAKKREICGVPKSEEFKTHLRAKMRGRPATWLKGKRLSPEHVEKIRAASTGRKHTDELKRAVAERNRRIQHLLHSDEAKQKRRDKMKGRQLPPEQRENMRLGQ